MDKWVVNNYIVQMRSSVSQARVQILNKLVREIRKLQNKKGSEQQTQKNQRKAERFKQEVVLIKKLVPNEVSKFALLFKDNPEEVLQRDSTPLEVRAKLRLVAHRSVVLQVEIFRAKYPDWELKLPPLVVQLGLKKKQKKNMHEIPDSDTTLEPIVKESTEYNEKENALEHSDQNTANKFNVNKNSLENSITEDEGDGEEKFRENALPKGIEKKKKKTNGIAEVRRFADIVISNSSEISRESVSKTNPVTKKKGEKKKPVNGVGEVCRFADLMDSGRSSESSEEEEGEEESSTKNEVSNHANASADPFFLTGDDSGEDDEFDRTDRDQTRENSSVKGFGRHNSFEKNSGNRDMNSKDDKNVPTLNRRQRRMLERANGGKKAVPISVQIAELFPKRFESSTKSNLRSFSRQEDVKKVRAFISASKEQESLHPSWEAKRKQREQQIILPFQGKKIKFDDD